MIYQCQKCGLSKCDGAMGSVLPQCKCDWTAPASKPFDTHAAPGQSFDTHSRTPQPRKPQTGEQIDRAITDLGRNYFADAANAKGDAA